MLIHPTKEKLHQLKLHGMLAAMEEQDMSSDLSFEERLGLLQSIE